MAAAKPSTKKRPFTVWVNLRAQLGFKVLAENPETALAVGREEMKSLRLVSEDVEYMDGEEKIIGVLEDE